MIKIGIIGMSEGNAHPYSWSAIINGVFDGDEITKVGYPGVATYLQANKDTLGINSAKVTHVWTQDSKISKSIAGATGIEHICNGITDMIAEVDAVILSRDDPEFHVEMSRPFIDAGIPVFIDKPLAMTTADLNYYKEEQAKGKFIMSCSSMRYSAECRTAKTELSSLGPIELITAIGKKDWPKYGVHLLEGIFSLLGDPQPDWVKHIGEAGKDIVQLKFKNGTMVMLQMYMDITPVLQFSIFGQKGWRLVEIKNSYSMFRDNIIEFIRSVQEGKPRFSFGKTEAIIRTLIGAEESLKAGGKTIQL